MKRQPRGTPVGGQFAEERKPDGGDLATPETMAIDDVIDQFRADAKKEQREFEKTADPEDESGYAIDSSYMKGRVDAFYDAARELRIDKSKANVTRLISEFTAKSEEARNKSLEYGVGDDLTDDLDDEVDAARLNGFSEGYAEAAERMKKIYADKPSTPADLIAAFTTEADAADREFDESDGGEDYQNDQDASYADGRRHAYYDAASRLKGARSKSDVISLVTAFTAEADLADREYEESNAGEDLEDISNASYADGRRQAYYDAASKLRAMDVSSLFG